MEQESQVYDAKYQIILIKGDPITINYKQFIKLDNVLKEGKQKFIRVGDCIVSIGQIAQIVKTEEVKTESTKLPYLNPEERAKARKKYIEMKNKLKLHNIID